MYGEEIRHQLSVAWRYRSAQTARLAKIARASGLAALSNWASALAAWRRNRHGQREIMANISIRQSVKRLCALARGGAEAASRRRGALLSTRASSASYIIISKSVYQRAVCNK